MRRIVFKRKEVEIEQKTIPFFFPNFFQGVVR
jgi:hypothetical protein